MTTFLSYRARHAKVVVAVQTVQRDANRSRDQIIAEVLEQMLSPVQKTSVMYGAKVSYSQLAYYLELLLRWGLISTTTGVDGTNRTFFVTTEKGRKYIDAYETIRAVSR